MYIPKARAFKKIVDTHINLKGLPLCIWWQATLNKILICMREYGNISLT